MASPDQQLLAILYQALSEPRGLFIATNSPVKARQRFYVTRARAKQVDGAAASLDQLRIMLSPRRSNELVILRADSAEGLLTPDDLESEELE